LYRHLDGKTQFIEVCMQNWQDALLVYSTESGKIKPEPKEQARSVSSDGVVRIHRETKGRKGKGVSLIKGLDLASDELKKLGSELKKKCGCGGAVKDGVIEVQTDDREKLRTLLTDKGYKVKLAGG
jgi:translation initiation factor 1|tara:strand:+ start:4250 stop:4627 length:378 start_codon:yes stop_codon:yes gene_type:complete